MYKNDSMTALAGLGWGGVGGGGGGICFFSKTPFLVGHRLATNCKVLFNMGPHS